MFAHFPAGASTQTIGHYVQLMNRGKFLRYDYDVDENLRRYGQAEPPLYNLSLSTSPAALFYSTGDLVIDADVSQCNS